MATTEEILAFQAKLRTLGFTTSGQKQPRTTPVLSETTGKPCGSHTEHKDGRVDATAIPAVVTATPGIQAKKKVTP